MYLRRIFSLCLVVSLLFSASSFAQVGEKVNQSGQKPTSVLAEVGEDVAYAIAGKVVTAGIFLGVNVAGGTVATLFPLSASVVLPATVTISGFVAANNNAISTVISQGIKYMVKKEISKPEASFDKTSSERFTTILANKIRNTDKGSVGTKGDEPQRLRDEEIDLQDSEIGEYEKVHSKTYGMDKKDSSNYPYANDRVNVAKVNSFDSKINKTQQILTLPNTLPQADYQKVYNEYLQQPPWQQVNRLGYIAFSSLSPGSNPNADFTDLMNAVRSRDWDRVLATSEVLYNNGKLNELAIRAGYSPRDFNYIAGTGISSYHDLRNQYGREEFNKIFEQSIRYIENTNHRE